MSAVHTPFFKNAPGDFYVAANRCMQCGAARRAAPHLLIHDEDEEHCYFLRQPSNDEEVYEAMMAMAHAELGCHRYKGQSAEMLIRMAEAGLGHLCDHAPPVVMGRAVRTHVTFRAPAGLEAVDLAEGLARALSAPTDEPTVARVSPIRVDGRVARFTLTREICGLRDHRHELAIGPGEPDTERWLIAHTVADDRDPHALGHLIHRFLRAAPGFGELRWHTADAYGHHRPVWRSTPI